MSRPWFEYYFDGLFSKLMRKHFTLDNVFLKYEYPQVRRHFPPPPSKVLDIPCGLGRLSLALAGEGYDVVGVDFKEEFVSDCAAISRRAGLSANFIVGDMRSFCFKESFHVALNYGQSFGYFDEVGERKFCREVYNALVPGGIFFAEYLNKTVTVRQTHLFKSDHFCSLSVHLFLSGHLT
ncbi:MAG: class I SAM-dependent methyltransferase, partial [Candidatus Thiodiazotropha endolucinida]